MKPLLHVSDSQFHSLFEGIDLDKQLARDELFLVQSISLQFVHQGS